MVVGTRLFRKDGLGSELAANIPPRDPAAKYRCLFCGALSLLIELE